MSTDQFVLSRNAEFSDVAIGVNRVLKRILPVLGILLLVEAVILFNSANPATMAFVLIATGTMAALIGWTTHARGLPLVALFAAQSLVIYALPIVVGNEGVFKYSAEMLTKAGLEVFAFNIAMIAGWRLTFAFATPRRSLSLALIGFDSASSRLVRLGMTLIFISTSCAVLNSVGYLGMILNLLPAGSGSIVTAVTSAVSACGFFLCAMMIASGRAARSQAVTFWVLFATQMVVGASGLLLSTVVTIVFSVGIGLFWGAGRIPWRYMAITLTALAFLNVGKATMREKYWDPADGEPTRDFTFTELPRVYEEWAGASFDALTGAPTERRARDGFASFDSPEQAAKGQSLFQRINNLENLLFVVDAVQTYHVPPLGGATYGLIPPLLVPRILWPDKPRSHQGQVMLNVYYGRQDLNSTYRTYIAWGLLPEAYGNFGPLAGALTIGAAIGILFALIENYVASKLILSLEGFLAFALFLGLANSYEMVASVLVTSLFQSFVPIIIATFPFVARIAPRSDAPPPEAPEHAADDAPDEPPADR